jgi:predicted anti-sigma-YlaC factor YlaD
MTSETHLDAETLSAYADAELNAVVAGRVERHLSECDVCRATLRKVRELVTAAQALPRDIAPPSDVWSALRERIAREPVAARAQPRWWHNGWLAMAAAVVLVAGTAILTTGPGNKAKATKIIAMREASTPVAPVLLAVDRNYSPTLVELRETLDAQRTTLAPATVRTVERALAVIDSAIAEARSALASDPANQALVDILSAHYERKVDLLQRATELSSSL